MVGYVVERETPIITAADILAGENVSGISPDIFS